MTRLRIRTLKPEMWADERVGRLRRDARLLWTVLLTMADDEGRLRALPAGIIGHGYPYGDATASEIERWLAEIAAAGLIDRYEHEVVPYVAIRGWERHQRINRPTPSSLPAAPGASHGVLRESSVTDHVALTEPSSPDQDQDQDQDRSSSAPVPAADEEVARLSHLLADLILQRDPRARVAPDSKRWQTDMRLLIADRQDDHGEVERVLRWSQADQFWQSNILSPDKLRAQFTQLRQRAANGTSAKDEATATRQRRAAAMRRQIGASS